MRITGWHVDGYGRFHDRRWEDLPPGLTVFHGPNEAGKSTLLSFLRSMLFGLRDGRSSDPAIPPLAGGRHGGVLRIADAQDAAWTIERHGRDLRVLDAGGTVHDEPTLRRILGNVNRDVFEAVFAFGLHELEQLGGLDDDALREQLFAAGLTGGGSSAHEALGALQKRVERVYRPRGESPLKALDDHLKDLRGQRREALEGQAEHGALRRREDELGAELAALEARIDDRRRDRDRLERLDRVWSLLEPLERERGELSRLAGAATVTAADVTAARTADGAADAARSQLDEVEERRAQTAERLAGLSVDEELVGAADALRALDREVPTQRERLLALSGLRGRRERSAEDARTAVADLGPGWDAARVRAIDASLPVRREAERHAEAVARTRVQAEVARERAAEAARRADGALEAERRASDAAAEAERRVGGADGDEGRRADHGSAGAERSTAAVDRAAAAIPEVRGALQDLLVRRSTLRQATDTLEELRAGASRPTRRPAPDTDRTRVPVLLVVAVLSVVAGIGIAVAGQPVAGVVLVVVGLAVGWAERIDRGGAASAQDAAASEAADAEAHAGRVRRQEERVAIEQDVVAGLEAQLRGAGPRADIDPDALVAATSTGPV
ncbi:AAA family ATPase, partial [Patulibacter minatonensis]|uniref:AAA family ATPase n=1 Tax=Patulibacter minatonensis TaxID=298163 RepID=UPI00047A4BAA